MQLNKVNSFSVKGKSKQSLLRNKEPVKPGSRSSVFVILALITSLVITASIGYGQFEKVKKLLRKVSLSSFLEGEPPVTTSLDDALTEIAYLDDYEPTGFLALSAYPQTADGIFELTAGVYELEAQSYCLHAGTYGPGGGDGYLYAPLAGPKVNIVRNILRNSAYHPEIPQGDIQVLLWAIIARTKISDMSRRMQQTAARLLSPKELLELNGLALGLVPDRLMREAVRSLPPEAYRIFEAEARLRGMLTTTEASYEEIERVAVLSGAPPLDSKSRELPEGRWSFHPEGYYIRFFPQGYSQTRIQVYVPEQCAIQRDSLGRITAIADQMGSQIEVVYDDTVGPATVGGDPGVQGYAFESIRFVQPDFLGPGAEAEGVGWTLVGVPQGNGQITEVVRPFEGLDERYRKVLRQMAEWHDLLGQPTLDATPENLKDLLDLAQFEEGLKMAFREGGGDEANAKANSAIKLVKKAWCDVFCQQAGSCVSDPQDEKSATQLGGSRWENLYLPVNPSVRPSPLDSGPLLGHGDVSIWTQEGSRGNQGLGQGSQPTSTARLDLSDVVATPGNRSRQRLAQSSRSKVPGLCNEGGKDSVTKEAMMKAAGLLAGQWAQSPDPAVRGQAVPLNRLLKALTLAKTVKAASCLPPLVYQSFLNYKGRPSQDNQNELCLNTQKWLGKVIGEFRARIWRDTCVAK